MLISLLDKSERDKKILLLLNIIINNTINYNYNITLRYYYLTADSGSPAIACIPRRCR